MGKRSFKPKGGAKKRKNNVSKPAQVKPNPASGDVDDFEDMLGTMPDREELSDGDQAPTAGDNDDAVAQKKKKRRKTKGQQMNALSFEASRQLAAQISELPAADQADWLWNDFTKHTSEQTELEREAQGLTESSIQILPPGPALEAQLKAAEPNWWVELCTGTGRPAGSPSVIAISPAAMGAVAFIKACPGLNKGCRIGKLFAKHFKIEEQQALLKTTPMCIAAGTPNRLCKLAELGALKLDKLKLILLDVELDAKKRTILDIPEVRADFWQFFNGHVRHGMAVGKIKIALVKCTER